MKLIADQAHDAKQARQKWCHRMEEREGKEEEKAGKKEETVFYRHRGRNCLHQ